MRIIIYTYLTRCYLSIILQEPYITHSKIEGHRTNMGKLFNFRDYSKHNYIAVPEVTVYKNEENQSGTPVLIPDPPFDHILRGRNRKWIWHSTVNSC